MLLVQAALPVFNQLTGQTLALLDLKMIYLVPSLIGVALGVGLLAGSYPAFVSNVQTLSRSASQRIESGAQVVPP